MRQIVKDALYVVAWSAFWVVVIAGIVLLVLQWRVLWRMTG